MPELEIGLHGMEPSSGKIVPKLKPSHSSQVR
jgi:hypothetical protein